MAISSSVARTLAAEMIAGMRLTSGSAASAAVASGVGGGSGAGASAGPRARYRAGRKLAEPEIEIRVDLGAGRGCASLWTCDLSYDYVKINAEYTT